MENENHIELIESFLDGRIARKEAMKLGGFASDKDLEEAVELYKQGLEDIYDLGLSNNLKEIHERLYGVKERRMSLGKILLVAASIVLLGVFGLLFFQKNGKPAFESYFEPYPNYELSRSMGDEELKQALALYSIEKFDSARIVFSSIRIDTLNYDYSFYFGITYLANGEFSKAADMLGSILGAGNANPYYQQTRWYLALAYWRNDQVVEAVEKLKGIEKGQYKYDEALELIKALGQ